MRVTGFKSALPFPADDDFVAAHVHLVGLQWTRRRAGNVASIEVVHAIVASAPDLVEIVAVLYGAAQVRANVGERSVLSVRSHEEERGPASKTNNLRAIRLEFANFSGHNFVAAKISDGRRNQVTEDRIDSGHNRGKQSAS